MKQIFLVGGYRASGRARCWGWYATFEEAVARMARDPLFFEGGHYTHGLIETYPMGMHSPRRRPGTRRSTEMGP